MARDRMAAEDFLLTHQTQVSKLEFDRLVGATPLAPRTNKKQRLLSEVGEKRVNGLCVRLKRPNGPCVRFRTRDCEPKSIPGLISSVSQ